MVKFEEITAFVSSFIDKYFGHDTIWPRIAEDVRKTSLNLINTVQSVYDTSINTIFGQDKKSDTQNPVTHQCAQPPETKPETKPDTKPETRPEIQPEIKIIQPEPPAASDETSDVDTTEIKAETPKAEIPAAVEQEALAAPTANNMPDVSPTVAEIPTARKSRTKKRESGEPKLAKAQKTRKPKKPKT
ncbi:hypothetical protein [Candidatus Magnetominusculus xianensis]|uniref:Uncharacterized protein n=1 Tax=Candidatus Magnetominusculus xianensis TaxID=1748249 RepID=A0ABR5SH03_9BACT|nr:hypothetical protein [Candidatus Magnetominusculus xianensis]KWT90970.1 hypothetical protein ASN18_1054 [Candidatus Magnetominusculus xianensis]MBF0403124.1 hypothetical protein [Nitrospirota bacterium]